MKHLALLCLLATVVGLYSGVVVTAQMPGIGGDIDDSLAPGNADEAGEEKAPPKPKLEKPNYLVEAQVPDQATLVPEEQFDSAQEAALAFGLTAVLQAAGNFETNPTGFPFRPRDTRKIVATVQVEVRYREEKRKQPVYKKEYEEYEVMVPVKDGSEIKLVKKTRRRLVSQVKVGEKTVTVLVRDPNGPIVRTENRHQYAQGDDQVLPRGFMGANAKALYVMNMAGLEPGSSDQQQTLYGQLLMYLKAFGLPDRNFDLAWLTMAFATYPGEADQQMMNFLITKLLLGQHVSGKVDGMWGPYSFNPEVHLKLTQTLVAVQAAHEKAQAALERRDTARTRKLAGELEARRDLLNMWILHMGRHALRTERYERGLKVPDFDGQLGHDVRVAGTDISIHQEKMVDLESTALVLRALRVANDYGYLPRQYAVDVDDIRNRPVFKKQTTQTQIRKALGAVLKLRTKEGLFDQGHIWERETAYDRQNMGLLRVPDVKLTSQVTLNSSLSGYEALASLQSLLGERLFTANAIKTMNELRALNLKGLDLPPLTQKGTKWSFKDYGYMNPEDGGMQRVWSNVELTKGMYRVGGYPIYQDEDRFRLQMLRVMNLQQSNGLWLSIDSSIPIISSSQWEYAKIRMERNKKGDKNKKNDKKQRKLKPSQYFPGDWSQNARLLATLAAMDSLMTNWRRPLAVLADLPSEESMIPVLQKTRRVINADRTIPAAFEVIEDVNSEAQIEGAMPLVIDLKTLTAERASQLVPLMDQMLAQGACVVLLGKGEADALSALTAGFKKQGLEDVEVGEGDTRLGTVFRQWKAKTKGWGKDGETMVYHFDRGGSAARGLFNDDQLAELLANLVLRYAKLKDLNLPDDPIAEDALFLMNKNWVEQLDTLNDASQR